MHNKDHYTLEAMERYGGGFVQQLAKLAHEADTNNLLLIKRTWSEYWSRYEKMGEAIMREE